MSERRPDDAGQTPAGGRSPALPAIRELFATVSLRQAVAAITALALAIRFVGLGARPFHFDEARVAYWSLYYVDSGHFAYRPIVHGPFIQLVNAWLVGLFGASDFLARAPVAVVGGLLPAATYLYREHLEKSEVVVLSLFLAFNAIFVYYSRFLRSDILLAGFMFAGFGFVVRYYDTRRVRYLYAAGALVALGLTTKENGLVYLLTWGGATALLVDHALFPPRGFRNGIDRIRQSRVGRFLGDLRAVALVPFRGTAVLEERWENPRAVRRSVALLAVHVVGAVAVAFLILVFFYADRGAGIDGLTNPPAAVAAGETGLWQALGRPLQFPGYAFGTVEHAFSEAINQWGSVSGNGDTPFLDRYAYTLGQELTAIRRGALAVAVLGVLGFVWERYGSETPRNLVMFMSYCGLASVVGYSLKNDPGTGKWLTIHLILPMMIPAAVGAGRLYRWGRRAASNRDTVGVFLVVAVALLLGAQMATATISTSYLDTTSEDNGFVQYAQPEADARDAFTAIGAVSDGQGTDAVIYLDENHSTQYELLGDESYWYREPACVGNSWTNTLPLPWYFGTADTNVSCVEQSETLTEQVQTDAPPMIITHPDDPTVPTELLAGNYTARTFNLYRGAHPVRFYVHEDYVDEAPGWPTP
ncbi:flippase activity-associated protein Agl23 [Salinibaculum rarum]|uniref:flippase activity-associated protein Agl23 n=1 Tax=Salinibaculum rarum TaxID=3058903 RepID=UPI00265F9EB7|nr:flippase activity-associated protein Agl23 [Salinibaculum sp. KK48]